MSASSRSSLFRAKLALRMLDKAKGFTLIELLVVIVIVGVLSAIAIPTFLNQIKRSRGTEAQSALSQMATGATVMSFDCGTYSLTATAAGGTTVAVTSPVYTGLASCSTSTGPWVEQLWTAVAINYNYPNLSTNTPTGVKYNANGSALAYVNIVCQKGAGDQANAKNDICTIP